MIRRCAHPGCPHLVRWAATCPTHRASTTDQHHHDQAEQHNQEQPAETHERSNP
jgi:hypothetical protein